MDRGTWKAIVHGVARVGHDLATKPPPAVHERGWYILGTHESFALPENKSHRYLFMHKAYAVYILFSTEITCYKLYFRVRETEVQYRVITWKENTNQFLVGYDFDY